MRILIAEDDPVSRRKLEFGLVKRGFEVIATANGAEAWETFEDIDPPLLAIIDVMMPGMDGLELCRRIRQRPFLIPPYLILLTAKSGKEDVILGLESGANDYVTKPFDQHELRARINVGLQVLALEQTLAARVKELEENGEQLRQSQKMEAVGQLAGGVAHDFNNLLTAIIGYSDLVLRKLGPADPLRKNVEGIKKAGTRATSLTRQLLAFSRKQMLQAKIIDLNSIVSDMDSMLQRVIGEDIDLVTLLEPSACDVKVDPGQIEQVILNLAVNARDAMPTGGKLTIETTHVYLDETYLRNHVSVETGSYVMLAVSDTGLGIDAETQTRVFEPFFTTKEVGKGTGLGLSTVYGIVKQSGGTVWLYSEVGKGSTFKVYLPVANQLSDLCEAKLSLPVPQGQETILLVEDEEMVRNLSSEILEMNGYRVLVAANGEDAGRICREHSGEIQLMVTDMVMPQMSGRELAERVALMRPGTAVLYMSGYTDDAIVRHGVLDDDMPFLQKPFTPDSLARKVREVLDRSIHLPYIKPDLRERDCRLTKS